MTFLIGTSNYFGIKYGSTKSKYLITSLIYELSDAVYKSHQPLKTIAIQPMQCLRKYLASILGNFRLNLAKPRSPTNSASPFGFFWAPAAILVALVGGVLQQRDSTRWAGGGAWGRRAHKSITLWSQHSGTARPGPARRATPSTHIHIPRGTATAQRRVSWRPRAPSPPHPRPYKPCVNARSL